MEPVSQIHCVERFPPLNTALVELLRGLSPAQWPLPTVCPGWTVKDVAAHLLDTNIRKLSFERDVYQPPPPNTAVADYSDLVRFLNTMNAEWVTAARRIGPRLLTDWLEQTNNELYEHLKTLDPDAPAMFPVAWAGQTTSPNWFDIAREYTEKWHHQQQIRDAVAIPGLTDRTHMHPVLDTFVRALPHTYRNTPAIGGTTVAFRVSGEAGGDWTLLRENEAWSLYTGLPPAPDSTVRCDQDTAWRLFTKGIDRDVARSRVSVEGDRMLGEVALGSLAVMA